MRLVYGGAQTADAGWARFQWGRDLLRNRAGIGYGLSWRCEASQLGLAVGGG